MKEKWTMRAAHHYTVTELIVLFLAFSGIGWVFEVALRLVMEGELVKRGTMMGPWLPIYGVGGVMAVLLLRRVAAHPLRVFGLGAGICTLLELLTGLFLEAAYGLRWWDYSTMPLNVDGLICPQAAIVFGLGCCAALYAVGPAIASLLHRWDRQAERVICTALVLVFAVDLCISAMHPNMGAGVAMCRQEQGESLRVLRPPFATVSLLQNNK